MLAMEESHQEVKRRGGIHSEDASKKSCILGAWLATGDGRAAEHWCGERGPGGLRCFEAREALIHFGDPVNVSRRGGVLQTGQA